MLPSDLKQYGREPSMPRSLVNFCLALVALIAVLTAYSLIADDESRMVVMSSAQFEQTIAAERIKAAQEMAEAVGTCGWRDLFREPKKQGAM